MPKLLEIVFTFKSHPLHAKISTQTGMPVPDEKVKELSSNAETLSDCGLLIGSGDYRSVFITSSLSQSMD